MALPVTAECVQVATRQDPVLSRVHQFTRAGWPARIPDGYQPYCMVSLTGIVHCRWVFDVGESSSDSLEAETSTGGGDTS